MSTWLDHGVSKYLVRHYFWMCLWGCFWKRAATESTDWVKLFALSSVDGHRPVCWGPEYNKKGGEREDPLSLPGWLSWDIYRLLPSVPCSQALRLRLVSTISSLVPRPVSYTTGFLGSPDCTKQIIGFLSLHNCTSQYLIINLDTEWYTHTHTHTHMAHILLVLFLWRTLTNTVK